MFVNMCINSSRCIYLHSSQQERLSRQALFWALEFAGAFLCSGPGGGDRGLAPKGDGAGG